MFTIHILVPNTPGVFEEFLRAKKNPTHPLQDEVAAQAFVERMDGNS